MNGESEKFIIVHVHCREISENPLLAYLINLDEVKDDYYRIDVGRDHFESMAEMSKW